MMHSDCLSDKLGFGLAEIVRGPRECRRSLVGHATVTASVTL